MRALTGVVLASVLCLSVGAAAGPALNPDVVAETVADTVCRPGYTRAVRPASSYTNAIKVRRLIEAGLEPSAAPSFQLDHAVPLALGGHPRALSNLVLQPLDLASRKNRIERKLQCLVCTGQIGLDDARREIAEDWDAAYHRYALVKCRRPSGGSIVKEQNAN
jgi:cytochrome c-type biogenesis protein CcmH/NrfF